VELTAELAYDGEAIAELEMRDMLESVWRAAGEQDSLGADPYLEKNMVWLECDFEFIDASSVKTLGVRGSSLGAEMVRFVCPRCGQRHESLRFR
jgi:hypothetical protein